MEIIPRAKWGAVNARGFGPAPLPASEVWLHHSVTIAPDLIPPFDDDYTAVRTLERIGQQRFGGGISYTFAVTPVGLVFEGHGIDRLGAHTGGRNSIARAICLIGDYTSKAPTSAQKQSIAELLVHGYKAGWWKAPKLTGGHRDAPGASTACPGNAAHRIIPEINALATQLSTAKAKKGIFMYLTEVEERELLKKVRDIHWKQTQPLNYSKHHGNPLDDQYGHVLGIRMSIAKLEIIIKQIQANLPKT